ncbi:hypothetical protein [Solibacillus silvestris]|uniref:hypothetical protein n=1 Tax=Solibacillus silvestris TaxID=76853 RepID=UPI00030A0EE0|nr:hypothetical protein [Solibacillus silvestris]
MEFLPKKGEQSIQSKIHQLSVLPQSYVSPYLWVSILNSVLQKITYWILSQS